MMNQFPSLHISNLPKENFFDLDFYKFFTNRGYKVKSAKIVLDSKTAKSRGYGYLQFINKDDALKCMKEMDNIPFGGKNLRIIESHSNPKETFKQEANIWIKNIPAKATSQSIRDQFQAFGTILSIKYTDGTGYAYVQFESEAAA